MYRENAGPSRERLAALVDAVRAASAPLADDFFELEEHRGLRTPIAELLELKPESLDDIALARAMESAGALLERLQGATAGIGTLRISLDALPEGFPPVRPAAKGFLQALLGPLIALGDVNRVEDVRKTLRRKWLVEFEKIELLGADEARFEMRVPTDDAPDGPPMPVLLRARCVSSAADPRVTLRNASFQALVRPGAPALALTAATVDADGRAFVEGPPFPASPLPANSRVDADGRASVEGGPPSPASPVPANSRVDADGRALRRAAFRLAIHPGFRLHIAGGVAEIAFERIDLLEGIPDVFAALVALRRLRSRYLLLR